ncbi:MAG: hypothetical protein OEZ68_22105 [Gammaproteobacteria bacterium]|nr:hypothetical protein [Gammaproteobacteria bacterium]MDH5803481.1 hypothetical protein [Gammaproteobacteria bacterium]
MIPLTPKQIAEKRAKEDFLNWYRKLQAPKSYKNEVVLSNFSREYSSKTKDADVLKAHTEFSKYVSENYFEHIAIDQALGNEEYTIDDHSTSLLKPV